MYNDMLINAAVIGLGVGTKHLETLMSRKDIAVTHVCDYDPEKEALAKKLRFKGTFHSNFSDVPLSDLNLLVIASNDEDHTNQVLAALHHNVHIFVEKPLCLTRDEFVKIKQAYGKAQNVNICSNFILRKEARFIELKKRIKRGDLGKIYFVDVAYDYGRFFKIKNGWRGETKNYSTMLGGGIHMIDLVCWLTDEKISVSHHLKSNLAAKENDVLEFNDLEYFSGRLTKGAICAVKSNYASQTRHHHQIKIYGTKGTFVHEFNKTKYYFGDDANMVEEEDHTEFPIAHKGLILNDFVDFILDSSKSCGVSSAEVFNVMETALDAI